MGGRCTAGIACLSQVRRCGAGGGVAAAGVAVLRFRHSTPPPAVEDEETLPGQLREFQRRCVNEVHPLIHMLEHPLVVRLTDIPGVSERDIRCGLGGRYTWRSSSLVCAMTTDIRSSLRRKLATSSPLWPPPATPTRPSPDPVSASACGIKSMGARLATSDGQQRSRSRLPSLLHTERPCASDR